MSASIDISIQHTMQASVEGSKAANNSKHNKKEEGRDFIDITATLAT